MKNVFTTKYFNSMFYIYIYDAHVFKETNQWFLYFFSEYAKNNLKLRVCENFEIPKSCRFIITLSSKYRKSYEK